MPQSLRISILLLMVLLSTTVSDGLDKSTTCHKYKCGLQTTSTLSVNCDVPPPSGVRLNCLKHYISFIVIYRKYLHKFMYHQRKIAVIGEGVVGCSAALALIERDPSLDITVIYDTPFKDTVSWGPAGLFRVEYLGAKPYGKRSFERYAKLFRELGGDKSGVNLLSGHILSTNLTELVEQDENYGDIVYNFRYLTDHEIKLLIAKQPSDARLHGIHYTTYTTEGRVYVPWMKSQLLKHGVKFVQRRVNTVEDLYPEFDVIVNCAGLNGGKVAGDGDDKNMFPIRGIIFQVGSLFI
ncbi:hypothetical protein AB6A40_009317 [Gnathostoma spinigerum]|uniref:FAD dependent oxidoreductase domain-containing protein n=1 Tax=Gnathostoma spinigerum TaxID=75299 RepID=A0ABD6ES18_9BILA